MLFAYIMIMFVVFCLVCIVCLFGIWAVDFGICLFAIWWCFMCCCVVVVLDFCGVCGLWLLYLLMLGCLLLGVLLFGILLLYLVALRWRWLALIISDLLCTLLVLFCCIGGFCDGLIWSCFACGCMPLLYWLLCFGGWLII